MGDGVMPCHSCGVGLRPEARFCPGCGTAVEPPTVVEPASHWPDRYGIPPGPQQPTSARAWGSGHPPRPNRGFSLPVLVAATAVLVLGLAVGAAIVLLGPAAGAGTSVTANSASAPEPTSTRPPTSPSTVVVVPSTPAAAYPTESARVALQDQAAVDAATIDSIVGYWVPQISSKSPGLVVDGVPYDEAQIWHDFRVAAAAYPDVALLRSDDYSSFQRGGFWVTIIATPFTTAEQANAWCDAYGFSPDDCFAKRLSHDEGPQGNTVPRR